MSHQARSAPSAPRADFTMSTSVSDIVEDAADARNSMPMPFKSTLPSNLRRQGFGEQGKNMVGQELLRPDLLGRHDDVDVTLSTDQGTAVDDFGGQMGAARDGGDDSFIPGVGRGHHRPSGSYSGLNHPGAQHHLSSHQYIHPSPATAARHDRLRSDAVPFPPTSRAAARPLLSSSKRTTVSAALSSSSGASESESESNASTATSASPFKAVRRGTTAMPSVASTGNHAGLAATPLGGSMVGTRNPSTRPVLDVWALDELDQAMGYGRASAKVSVILCQLPASIGADEVVDRPPVWLTCSI